MKIVKNFLKSKSILVLVLFALVFTSCFNDDDGAIQRPNENIVELAEAEGLSSFVAALQRADLVSVLETKTLSNYTVLAPTNAAFNTFLTANNYASLDEVPIDELQQILLNHIIVGELFERDLLNQTGYTKTSADGPIANSKISIFVNGTDGIRFNDTSSVTPNGANIIASNGTIHIVDAVIPIPNVVDFVTINPSFSKLVTALTTATPSVDFVSLLRDTGVNTIFAPTDVAFDALLATETDWSTVDDIDETLLSAVLSHHVVGGANILSTAITDGLESPATLEGDTLTFERTTSSAIGITDGAGNRNINAVIIANIQGINGVIHVINKVLIPDTTN